MPTFCESTCVESCLKTVGHEASFLEILASTYGPGPLEPYGPGSLIILKNILSWICSMTIFEKHTALGAHSKHAPGAVCISNMVLSIFELENSFRLWMVQDHKVLMVQDHMVLDHKSRPKSAKKHEAIWLPKILEYPIQHHPASFKQITEKSPFPWQFHRVLNPLFMTTCLLNSIRNFRILTFWHVVNFADASW